MYCCSFDECSNLKCSHVHVNRNGYFVEFSCMMCISVVLVGQKHYLQRGVNDQLCNFFIKSTILCFYNYVKNTKI